jgi:glucose uptake protein
MFIVHDYTLAVALCFLTMLCWGSWANSRKLASKDWRFELFYWDYALGVVLLAIVVGLTLGSTGAEGRSFFSDLLQASGSNLGLALLGGAVFNLANILLVAAIELAGMAVAFPVGIGLALLIGVLINYVAEPVGSGPLLAIGVGLVILAILLDAIAYRRLGSVGVTTRGLVLSVACGVFMGLFYRFVAAAMYADPAHPVAHKMGPYAAFFVFAVGVFLSNFLWNTLAMKRPVIGSPVGFSSYFRGSLNNHLTGVLGGIIWGVGMSTNLIASGRAGYAISYGLGQGATMIAALWGVFIWKEFRLAPQGTAYLLASMFACFLGGLAFIVAARTLEASMLQPRR